MAISIDSSSLLGFYQARTGGLASAGVTSSGSTVSGKPKYAPTPPWATTSTALKSSELVKQALAGRRFIDEGAAQLDLPGASGDYKKLFALYQGLNALNGLAERAKTTGITQAETNRLAAVFTRGLTEITGYADKLKMDTMRITRGDTMITNKSEVGVPRAIYGYKTGKVHTGAQGDAVAAFQGDVKFDIAVKRGNVTHNIAIDLADISGARTMGAVTAHINDRLSAAGLQSRFSVERTPGEPRKVTTGGTTVTLPAMADDYAFKISGDSIEQLTFSAASTTPAVYVTTYAGNPDPDKNTKTEDGKFESTLVKLDGATVGAPGSKISSGALEGTIETVRASKIDADGALYVLAEVDGTVDNQTVKGERDVALLKYDSAGKLMYARTLGAADKADGLALSIAGDGRVAIAGRVTGELNGASNGPINSAAASDKTDSFVTVFDAKGDELWTQRRGALEADEATEVGFGDNGVVYVAGRTRSSLPGGGGMVGGWDSYLMAVAPDAKGAPKTLFTTQFGSAGEDSVGGMVVNGSTVTVAGVESGRGVLRSFTVTPSVTGTVRTDDNGFTNITTTTTTNGVPTVSSADYGAHNGGTDPVKVTTTTHTSAASFTTGATRDLGVMGGGTIKGLGLDGGYLWVAGTTSNGALDVSGVTRAYNGAQDAFAARLSTDLSSTAGDNLAYFGGTGNDTVTAMSVADGKVWVAGGASADQPGAMPISTRDGYLAKIDVTSGAVEAQRVTGKDGMATATSIAVDTTGASALDKLGLPKGALLYADSQRLVSSTSVRAGDSFQIRTAQGGRLSAVTIEANDTLDSLAEKVQRAGGRKVKVEVVADGEYRRIKVSPQQKSASVEILPGKGGSDALEAIGLAQGVVRNTVIDKAGKSVSADGKGPVFGIGLDIDLNLGSKDGVAASLAAIAKSLTRVRDAYRTLESAAKPAVTAAPGAGGAAPAYLTNQISNYQAALDRLTGGF